MDNLFFLSFSFTSRVQFVYRVEIIFLSLVQHLNVLVKFYYRDRLTLADEKNVDSIDIVANLDDGDISS